MEDNPFQKAVDVADELEWCLQAKVLKNTPEVQEALALARVVQSAVYDLYNSYQEKL